jgi:hypothetical protein
LHLIGQTSFRHKGLQGSDSSNAVTPAMESGITDHVWTLGTHCGVTLIMVGCDAVAMAI